MIIWKQPSDERPAILRPAVPKQSAPSTSACDVLLNCKATAVLLARAAASRQVLSLWRDDQWVPGPGLKANDGGSNPVSPRKAIVSIEGGEGYTCLERGLGVPLPLPCGPALMLLAYSTERPTCERAPGQGKEHVSFSLEQEVFAQHIALAAASAFPYAFSQPMRAVKGPRTISPRLPNPNPVRTEASIATGRTAMVESRSSAERPHEHLHADTSEPPCYASDTFKQREPVPLHKQRRWPIAAQQEGRRLPALAGPRSDIDASLTVCTRDEQPLPVCSPVARRDAYEGEVRQAEGFPFGRRSKCSIATQTENVVVTSSQESFLDAKAGLKRASALQRADEDVQWLRSKRISAEVKAASLAAAKTRATEMPWSLMRQKPELTSISPVERATSTRRLHPLGGRSSATG